MTNKYKTHQEEFYAHLNSLLFNWVPIIAIIYWLLMYFGGCFMDPTDASAKNRSGLNVHVDYETGVNYLSRDGVLIPRLDSEGNIYINKEREQSDDQ